MIEKNKFSIIIPVYNVQKYLPVCIDSILAQNFEKYEVILVDDGSTDESGRICDEYANRDPHCKVVHKKNGGLSSARNMGIEVADGEYLMFIDSDDFLIGDQCLSEIEKRFAIYDADVVVFPMIKYYADTGEYIPTVKVRVDEDKLNKLTDENRLMFMIANNIFRASACNKVLKKSLIDDLHLRFMEGYLSEDLDWCGNILIQSKRIVSFNTPIYGYRQKREESITNSTSNKLIEDKLYMCQCGCEIAKTAGKDKERVLLSYYAYEYSVLIGISSGANDELVKEIKEMQYLLKYDICKKVKAVKVLRNLFGFEMTRKMLCCFVKNKR